jgi:hypothetical protein
VDRGRMKPIVIVAIGLFAVVSACSASDTTSAPKASDSIATDLENLDTIGQCLRESGFEDHLSRPDPELSDFGVPTQDGYGISDRAEPAVIDESMAMTPEEEYLGTLAASAQDAYSRTLQGCWDRLLSTSEATVSIDLDLERLNESTARIEADPRVVEARRLWSECVYREAGVRAEQRSQIVAGLEERWRELAPALGLLIVAQARLAGDQASAARLPSVSTFDEFVELETTLALTDLGCDDEASLSEVLDDVAAEFDGE